MAGAAQSLAENPCRPSSFSCGMFADIRHRNTAAPDTRRTAATSGQRRSFHHAMAAAATPVMAAVARMWAALNVISGFLLPVRAMSRAGPGLHWAASADAEFLCHQQHGNEDQYPQQQLPPWRVEEALAAAGRRPGQGAGTRALAAPHQHDAPP